MFDQHLLQLVRKEIAAFAGRLELSPNLQHIDRVTLKAYVDRLFYGGEIEARCSLRSDGLQLEVRGLTAHGLKRLREASHRGWGEPR